MEDDPQRRKPDITRAMKYLNWKPKVRWLNRMLDLSITYHIMMIKLGFIFDLMKHNMTVRMSQMKYHMV